MKSLRRYSMCWILIAKVFASGCATTGTAGYHDGSANEASASDDMTPAQKFLSYMAWPFQYGLLWGGSALASH